MKNQEIPDNSIDLIFTDPPYKKETLYLYGELAKVAIRVLKPGGHLVIYVGGYELFEIVDYLTSRNDGEGGGLLNYWFYVFVRHTGSLARMYDRKIVVNGKLLLWQNNTIYIRIAIPRNISKTNLSCLGFPFSV